jgi:GTP cyclohydrolase II/3,4-dihydroxy 2-butanone 4-phosphate synthase/GTP cyclohydrolase II
MILPSKAPSSTARTVVRYAESIMPTHRGDVRIVVYREVENGVAQPEREHVAIIFGELMRPAEEILVRVHSECMTSEVFGSLKCDCKQQLDHAMDAMKEQDRGVLIYLRQEGRGIGLGNKIRAYALQSMGADTIQANHQLGFETDLRTYDIAAGVLHDLGVRSVRLMTNNPLKIHGLETYGIQVTERLPINVEASEHSADYLRTKQEKLGHLIE